MKLLLESPEFISRLILDKSREFSWVFFNSRSWDFSSNISKDFAQSSYRDFSTKSFLKFYEKQAEIKFQEILGGTSETPRNIMEGIPRVTSEVILEETSA